MSAATSAEAGTARGVQIVRREPELEALVTFLDSGSTGSTLVLTGGPGIGKTALWEPLGANRAYAFLGELAVGREPSLH